MSLEAFEKLFSFDELFCTDMEKACELRESILEQVGNGSIKGAFDFFFGFTKKKFDLQIGTSLFNVLKAIQSRVADDPEVNSALSGLAYDFLQTEWPYRPKSEQVATLVVSFIHLAPDPLQVIEFFTNKLFPIVSKVQEGKEKDKDKKEKEDNHQKVHNFHTLTDNTLPAYYRVVFSELIHFLLQVDTNVIDDEAVEALEKLKFFTSIFSGLVELTKVFTQKNIVAVALKQSKVFIEAFVKGPFILLKSQFKDREETVREIFKIFQKGTRRVQVSQKKTHSSILFISFFPKKTKDTLHACQGTTQRFVQYCTSNPQIAGNGFVQSERYGDGIRTHLDCPNSEEQRHSRKRKEKH